MFPINRRKWMTLSGAAFALRGASAGARQAQAPDASQPTPDELLLKAYRPQPIFKIPKTDIKKAKYPVIDVHSHGPRPIEQLPEFVKTMDAANVEKTVILTGANSVERFAEISRVYSSYPGRFELWCGFDLTGFGEQGFGPNAVKALEECHRLGAVGVGEVSDKGWGFRTSAARRSAVGATPAGQRPAPGPGPHPDDPRIDALWDKCAQLGMPVNIHVSDPIWAYEPMDKTNDGLPNGYKWRIDDKQPGIFGHNALIESLERTLEKHRKTIFVACHLVNLGYDLTRLGQMLERHPNLYLDISARFGELAPIPRASAEFFQKYPDRSLYGSDMAYSQRMFTSTFRILETLDEHFYEFDLDVCYDYHWPLHGFGLPDALLTKIYRDNALEAFRRARS